MVLAFKGQSFRKNVGGWTREGERRDAGRGRPRPGDGALEQGSARLLQGQRARGEALGRTQRPLSPCVADTATTQPLCSVNAAADRLPRMSVALLQ